uniref:Ubiquitin associated and SH3 domain containing A n=1 Tax=Canis lupus familiaris TaxID=9615 RepID=A0A8I3Q9V2_CANLF
MAAGETQLYAKVSNKHKGRSTPSLLDTLLGMGFPAHTALKALAATGRKTAEEASDWLRCHRNDPSLDDPIPQEYALFLCPTGPLLEKLEEFWKDSKRQCAKNRAHEVFPHITLCDFFTKENIQPPRAEVPPQLCFSPTRRFQTMYLRPRHHSVHTQVQGYTLHASRAFPGPARAAEMQ